MPPSQVRPARRGKKMYGPKTAHISILHGIILGALQLTEMRRESSSVEVQGNPSHICVPNLKVPLSKDEIVR